MDGIALNLPSVVLRYGFHPGCVCIAREVMRYARLKIKMWKMNIEFTLSHFVLQLTDSSLLEIEVVKVKPVS